ncbi:MAG TPA: class I SAM-dependent methyltransferase [Jatrophihabitans sp.]|nr:class I SAM-dependent methyltransferase [Jatrophihabitans sp.]
MRLWPARAPSFDAGPIAPDGSAVAMYAALPVERAMVGMLHRALPPAGPVLDLGAGTGRLAGPLAALGHPVVAVDNSPEMLARVPAGIRTVCADITTLALPDRFSGVVLSAYLFDYAELDRPGLLRICRRHLLPDGRVFVQRQPPEWYAGLRARSYRTGRLRIRIEEPDWLDADRVVLTMRYRLGRRHWSHRVVSRRSLDERLPELLAEAGLCLDGFLDHRRSWLAARVVGQQPG